MEQRTQRRKGRRKTNGPTHGEAGRPKAPKMAISTVLFKWGYGMRKWRKAESDPDG